jgi:hypothetical protein
MPRDCSVLFHLFGWLPRTSIGFVVVPGSFPQLWITLCRWQAKSTVGRCLHRERMRVQAPTNGLSQVGMSQKELVNPSAHCEP